MGKEWLFWVGGGGSSKSTKKRRSSGGAEREAAAAAAAAATPTGCMCAVFQIFDLHHLPFAMHHQPSFKPGSFLQDEPTIRKGLEAPRNSLELEEPSKEDAGSLSSTMKQLENLNIPVNIQIRTSCVNKSPRASISKARTDDILAECSSGSPGAKTPTLVARLMGLDQLPESSTISTGSPSLHSSSTLNSLTNLHMQSQRREQSPISRQHLQSRSCSNNKTRGFLDNDITTGTLSLPETPRISSARRSDVEHRLSLQINKENIGEEFEFSACTAKKLARRISESRREDENYRRGGHYARQIVKQVKESVVSRKVGQDITNTVKSREQRRYDDDDDDDDHVVLLKPKKPSNNNKVVLTRLPGDESSQSKQSTPSSSPRLLEYPKNKTVLTKTQSSQYSPRLSPLSPSPERQSKLKPQAVPIVKGLPNHQQPSAVRTCKKDASEKYNSRLKKPLQVSDAIRNKKEEPFIHSATTNKGNVADKKCKKTPLSNELLHISTVPTLLPVKKDIPFPATNLADKQAQASDAPTWKRSTQTLSSCSSQSYKQQQQKKEVTHILNFQENIQDRCCQGSSSTFTSTSNSTTSPGDEASVVEYQYYIQRILKRTGIDKSTPVSLAKWDSSSHPLDPSIFHYIELFHPTTITPFSTFSNSKLILRSNRRLVFQLVDELLAEILEPCLSLKPCCLQSRRQMYGSELIDTLCARINKFPSANCQVLEDIDALVYTDLRSRKSSQLGKESFDDEGEGIVLEIEREILESLVHETAMEVACG